VKAWRLLDDGDADGAWNMAVDEVLLASASQSIPTLRFYTWRGPWLSLGYAQTLSPERQTACRDAGVGVVRRMTGGRAVLHGRDLTYALAAPKTLLPEGLRASYDLVAGALVAALSKLGVDAERWSPEAASQPLDAFDCFATPVGDEICAGGRKLAGSAQRRVAGAVLQHGSIRLAPDAAADRGAAGVRGAGATSLTELGTRASQPDLRAACHQALAAALGCRFQRDQLDRGEWARARRSADLRRKTSLV
jgi:lipoate-protein ligase A